MDELATLITTPEHVAEARAIGCCSFACELVLPGTDQVVAYASSGLIPPADIEMMAPICQVATGDHDPLQVIAAAGYALHQPPLPTRG